MKLNQLLEEIKTRAGSQQKLADEMKVNKANISRWLKGQRKIEIDVLLQLLDIVDIELLIYDKKEEKVLDILDNRKWGKKEWV